MNTSQTDILPSNGIFTTDEVQKFRNETSGTRNVIHLNNAGAGLMPDVVTRAQLDHIRLESEIGGYEAAEFKIQILSMPFMNRPLFCLIASHQILHLPQVQRILIQGHCHQFPLKKEISYSLIKMILCLIKSSFCHYKDDWE